MYEFGPRDPNLRAGDADREAIGERLRRHHAEGRLDPEEFQQRIDACYQAKTMGELHQLLTDLPRDEQDRPPFPPWPGLLPFGRRWSVPLVPILVAVVAICAITGAHALWIVIPLFFLARTWMWRRASWGWGRYRETRSWRA